MLRYCAVAGGLGLGWFVVLLVPSITRGWLLENVWQNLACLAGASVIVAVWCRRFIAAAETLSDHVVRGAALPYLGCVVFLSLWAASFWARTLLFGGLANVHDTLSLYVMGLTAAAISFLVVIPYGLLCQYVMHSAVQSSAN
jgi:hypothetical protein